MKKINEKWQAIILVTLVISFLSTGFSTFIIYNKNASVERMMNIQQNNISSIISTIEHINTSRYSERIRSLINYQVSPERERMLQAFKNNDRDLLFKLSNPFYMVLKKEDPNFSSFGWIRADNTVILRVGMPEIFDDNINKIRPDIVQANFDFKQNSGYETGKSGMEFRVTQPVIYNGEHLGVVQFGLEDSYLINLIKDIIGIPTAMVIPNKFADTIEFSKIPKIMSQSFTVQTYDIDNFSSKNIDWTLDKQRLQTEGKIFSILKIVDLNNFEGISHGSVFVAIDISKQLTDLWRSIGYIIILSVFFLMISVLFLYKSLDGLLQKNINLNNSLIEINTSLETELVKLNLAVNTAGDAILMTDERGIISYVNTAFTEIYNFNKKNIIGKTTATIFEEGAKNFEEYLKYGKDLINGQKVESELQYETNKGNLITIEISSSPIFDQNNKIIGFLSIQRDITERKRIERQIKSALSEKEALLRELYHRTQNNMQLISSMLSLKTSSMANDIVSSVFSDIDLKIQSMALVHQKLFDSQNLSNVNLKDYVRELCELFVDGYTLDPGKITLNFDLEEITVLIDIAIPLGLVISELASNSLKHAFPEGSKGNISIKLIELSDEFIELSFADNGIGVPSNFNFLDQKTLGLETISILAKDQLHGNVKFENDHGVSCTVKFKKNIYQKRI